MSHSQHLDPVPEDPTADLEKQADALLQASLRAHGQTDYPFYSNRWLAEMRRREEKQGRTPAAGTAQEARRAAELLDLLLAEVPLPPHHLTVVQLARQGLTTAEMSQRLGHPMSTVHRWLQQGLWRLREGCSQALTSSQAGAMAALLFRQSTQALRYHDEHHCQPGQEACRRDGLCRCRWYLYGREDGH